MKSEKRVVWVTRYGMLIALAFISSYLRAIIPVPIPVPGVRLGLASLVTTVGPYTVGVKGTAVVSLIRIVLVGLTFGNTFDMVYSLVGGSLSLLLTTLCKKNDWLSQIGVSIIGGIGHNVGQLVIASITAQTMRILYYLPALLVVGVLAGAVTGLLGGMVTGRVQGIIKKIWAEQKNLYGFAGMNII